MEYDMPSLLIVSCFLRVLCASVVNDFAFDE